MAFVSGHENCELYHDPQDQRICPFQSDSEGPHHEQPRTKSNCYMEALLEIQNLGVQSETLMIV